MIAAPMCFSALHSPRCRIYMIANAWGGNVHRWTRSFGTTVAAKPPHSSKICGHEGGGVAAKKWTRRPVTTKAEEGSKAAWSSKASSIKREILEGAVPSGTALNVNGMTAGISKLQESDVAKEAAKCLTIIAFDIETTGLHRKAGRIVEIAFRDLSGGENSTFQTLVNPDCDVLNSHIHGITYNMVSRPDVPRMVELVPIIKRFVKSRQKRGGRVLLVAHNARVFDVPFLINEFNRCGSDLPSDWMFLDTLPLGRAALKAIGTNTRKSSLQTLLEGFNIPQVGSAHRAMSDVNCLVQVFQRITFVLKLSNSDLVGRSFSAADVINQMKKI